MKFTRFTVLIILTLSLLSNTNHAFTVAKP